MSPFIIPEEYEEVTNALPAELTIVKPEDDFK
jgi:hypothetical protein